MKAPLSSLGSSALVALGLLIIPSSYAATTTLVSSGAVWRYLDDGSNQGTAWAAPTFDDGGWASGPAQLGYGDGVEATVVSYGPDGNQKYITTYFRHAFNVSDAAGFTSLSLGVVRDDGVVVYLNGIEVYRNNLPAGAIGYTTVASAAIGGADESAWQQVAISPALLVDGVNVVAAEIHQSSANSSDISFDLQLTGERPTMTITLNGPADGVTGVSLSPTLDVSVWHRDGSPMTVTFFGRVSPPVGPDFTLIALPDTQFYTSTLNGGTPQIFISQTEWILANLQSRNIVFMTQLGDCVQNGDNGGNDVEWRHATNALYRLEDPVRTLLNDGLPYGIAVGNHDQSPAGSATGTTTFYNQYFGEAHFAGRSYYGGHYGNNNDEHFELFSASGLNFIIIHLEYDANMTTASPELDWADQLLRTYSNRQAIIVSHWIMNSGEGGSFSTQGQAIYNRLKVNPNLFLMLCGHVNPNGEGKRTDVYNGNQVYTVLSDYQDRLNGGNGWLRIMEFSPANSVIRVRTYSPTLNQFETDANSQFDLPYDMLSLLGPSHATIATYTSVSSGARLTANWPNLTPSTDYEWYVSVSDGAETVTSPVWQFRTADQTLPAAPAPLVAAAQSSRQILLTWQDNADNEAGFEIYESLDNSTFSSIAMVGNDVTSALVNGLQPNTTYYYRVRAFNGAGYSADSPTASATTPPPPPPPAAPSNLTGMAASQNQVNLMWTDNANNEEGFRIERAPDGISFVEVGVVGPNIVVYSDSGLTPFTSYQYRVRAYNDGGNSDYSGVADVTTQPPPPPPAPTGLTAVGEDRSVTLTWVESPGANRYYLYRAEALDGPYTLSAYGIYTTTWIDYGVTPHTTYFYYVTALNDGGESAPSGKASATPFALPAAPSGATLTLLEVDAIEFTWTDNATDETGFRIERSVDNVTFNVVTVLSVDSVSFLDQGLSDNTTYYYRVYAVNESGQSAPATVSGTTLALPANAPSNLGAAAVSSSQIALSWTDNASNENGFKIERSQPGGTFDEIAILGVNATAYLDSGLAPDTTYAYRVRAFNPAGDSGFATASASTWPLPPLAPTDLAATVISSSQIELSWTDNAANETGFRIDRSEAGGPFVQIALLGANAIAFSDSGLAPATMYSYRLQAHNAGGSSPYSAPASATTLPNPPVAPTGLAASAASATRINLSWLDNASNETAYEIERKIGIAGAWSLVATVTANVTSYDDAGLMPSTTYYCRVRALNTGGYSPFSNEASATTPPPTTVTFTAVAAQDGYVLESNENSNSGGTAAATDATTSGLRAGDDKQDRQYKTVVSFDTSSIPDGVTIVSATLRLKRGTVSGISPFQTHGTCYVDIKSGNGFRDSTSLTKEDFQAPADVAQIATLSNATANGQWSEGPINAAGLPFVNKTGATQCRIYFQLDDNDDNGVDFIGWYSGNSSDPNNRPQLVIVYQ